MLSHSCSQVFYTFRTVNNILNYSFVKRIGIRLKNFFEVVLINFEKKSSVKLLLIYK